MSEKNGGSNTQGWQLQAVERQRQIRKHAAESGSFLGSARAEMTLGKLAVRLFVLVIVLVWTLPTLGVLVSSLRTPAAINATGWWQGLFRFFEFEQWTLSNYRHVLSADRMDHAFFNSLLITIPATVIPISMAAFAAFSIAWLRFHGREILFVMIVGLLVVPLQMALIPVLQVYTRYGITGTFFGMWLAHTGFGLPLATYILYGYISSIPKSILESAHADGATPWLTFTRLVLPLSIPAIASFAIFQFLWVWNDLLVALVFFGTRQPIVTTRLAELVGSRGHTWYVLTAGAFVSMVLPLLIFFSLQRYFVRGMMAGAVKG